jgi:hypothetical protein
LNPTLLDRKKMTAADLALAIGRADTASARFTAVRLGALIRAEDGVANAIKALERWGMLPDETGLGRSARGSSTPSYASVGDELCVRARSSPA